MTTSNGSNLSTINGFSQLRQTKLALAAALMYARAASENLAGSRKTRAEELHELIATAICHGDRLAFICEGELRAQAYSK
jgi:hypothetical protein